MPLWFLLTFAGLLVLALAWGVLRCLVRTQLWRPPPWRSPYDEP